jgi:hippurate hydrolase
MSHAALLEEATSLQPQTIELRRALHRQPEIGLDLPVTRQIVLDAIADLPLGLTLHETTSGIVAVLEGGMPGPTVLLRGDMDALPLQEDTGLDFASEVDGAMHACGHDLHTAMLASSARLLAARRDELAGKVVFMFQPGEEGFGGAKYMLDEGMLDATGEMPVRAFAIHVSAGLSRYPGVSCRGGAFMASADTVEITVNGAGGHASAPFLAVDPILAAAEVMTSIQTAITREVNAFDPAVFTVSQIHGGTTHNIIPPKVELGGTLRCVSDERRAAMLDLIPRVASAVAEAHGATAEVEFSEGYPVTINDDEVAAEVRAIATELFGEDRVANPPAPIMGAEDWSYVLQQVPGAMAFLDANPAFTTEPAANHSNLVVFNEDAMPQGVALYAAFAMESLAAHA